jgi:tetraacyldisaccharide 4'-kinase
VFAFAGIGRPEKFFATLRGAGATVVAARSFPDHHPYSVAEIDSLLAEAARLNAVPVTTPKDAVRLPDAVRGAVRAIGVSLVWDDPAAPEHLLDHVPG